MSVLKQAVDDNSKDIVNHMRQTENHTLPSVTSIDNIQHEIQWFMRPYLVDFLIEAHAALRLLPETLFLAINLLDRYCSKCIVYKRSYQLVGCASLLIAAKYDSDQSSFNRLLSFCKPLYDQEMLERMERHVLKTLDWAIGHPTVYLFLEIALSEYRSDAAVKHMARYICETALYLKEFVSAKPSVMAQTSLALAQRILGRQEVPETSFDDTESLSLFNQLSRPSQVSEKYKSPKMSCASISMDQFLQQQSESTASTRNHTSISVILQVGRIQRAKQFSKILQQKLSLSAKDLKPYRQRRQRDAVLLRIGNMLDIRMRFSSNSQDFVYNRTDASRHCKHTVEETLEKLGARILPRSERKCRNNSVEFEGEDHVHKFVEEVFGGGCILRSGKQLLDGD